MNALQERTLRKKLQQIEILEDRAQSGFLDGQQQAKVSLRPVLQAALQALQVSLLFATNTNLSYLIKKAMWYFPEPRNNSLCWKSFRLP